MTTYGATEIATARERLADLKPGTTIYTNLRRVSASGMSRLISVHVVQDGEIRDISHPVAVLTGSSFNRDVFALRVQGAGMDMGFHVVYSLGRKLFPDGVKSRKAGYPEDRDGGYAFDHRWL